MKKVILIAISAFILFLVVSYFIPVRKLNEVIVTNTYSNIIKATFKPRSWIKWNDDVREAWQKDSSSCHFTEDSLHHTSTIDIPGRQIEIAQENFLLYHLTENKNSHISRFTFLLTMNVGDEKGTVGLNTLITYGRMSRYLYKIFPFLEDTSFAHQTISSVKSYIEDPARIYGFPIELKQSADSIFLTRTIVSSKKEIFKRLPLVFNELDSFARSKGIANPVNKNIYFNYINKDSLSINAGVNINKIIPDDYLISCKQFYYGQIMVIGHYEGPFYKRYELYNAMDQFMIDHQFIKGGASYEKYVSQLPESDSSVTKIELYYPLLNRSSISPVGR
jgi:hypothetical protein